MENGENSKMVQTYWGTSLKGEKFNFMANFALGNWGYPHVYPHLPGEKHAHVPNLHQKQVHTHTHLEVHVPNPARAKLTCFYCIFVSIPCSKANHSIGWLPRPSPLKFMGTILHTIFNTRTCIVYSYAVLYSIR